MAEMPEESRRTKKLLQKFMPGFTFGCFERIVLLMLNLLTVVKQDVRRSYDET